MANQNYRIFPNKVEMFKFFANYSEDLNVGVSSRLPTHGFCVGSEHKAFRNSVEFFKALAELTGLDIDAEHSTIRMGSYIVFFNSATPNPKRRGKAVEATVSGPKGEEAKVEQVNTEPKSAGYEAILAEAAALNDEGDKKGSKDKLADLAATKGISLTKNKSFENMMSDFKTALEELEPAK